MSNMICNKQAQILAVKFSDTRFRYRREKVNRIWILANKVIEMQQNGLLVPEKLTKYEQLSLIHDKKQLLIPIEKNSAKYDSEKNVLSFKISRELTMTRTDLDKWHLKIEAN